jgi:Lrp/AsnC family leucine-responsive transcriptional regulator
MVKLDRIDRAILSALQDNSRIANAALAERVGLSQSACLRRVRQLEETGVIESYQAVISNRAIGQTITAIIQITLLGQSQEYIEDFERAVKRCPFIVACFLMSGSSDYILRVNARDMEHFEYIHKHWLSTLPRVSIMQSSFAMRMVVNKANIDISQM